MTQYFKNELKKPYKVTNYFVLAPLLLEQGCFLKGGVPNFLECKRMLKIFGVKNPLQRTCFLPHGT